MPPSAAPTRAHRVAQSLRARRTSQFWGARVRRHGASASTACATSPAARTCRSPSRWRWAPRASSAASATATSTREAAIVEQALRDRRGATGDEGDVATFASTSRRTPNGPGTTSARSRSASRSSPPAAGCASPHLVDLAGVVPRQGGLLPRRLRPRARAAHRGVRRLRPHRRPRLEEPPAEHARVVLRRDRQRRRARASSTSAPRRSRTRSATPRSSPTPRSTSPANHLALGDLERARTLPRADPRRARAARRPVDALALRAARLRRRSDGSRSRAASRSARSRRRRSSSRARGATAFRRSRRVRSCCAPKRSSRSTGATTRTRRSPTRCESPTRSATRGRVASARAPCRGRASHRQARRRRAPR